MHKAIMPIEQFKRFKDEITRFMMIYKFALDLFETKIEILKEEFQFLHDYNPIEHTNTRLKTPESILNKVGRKGCELSLPSIRENIKDIAGMRIICSFVSDIYRLSDMLQRQSDLKIVEIKDYILHPKPNGYQSLHLLVQVPVFMSDRQENVFVEVQIRTIAMDFWASLEHKIFYKFNATVPQRLLQELKEAADTAAALDKRMERLHKEIEEIKGRRCDEQENGALISVRNEQFALPAALLDLIEIGGGSGGKAE